MPNASAADRHSGIHLLRRTWADSWVYGYWRFSPLQVKKRKADQSVSKTAPGRTLTLIGDNVRLNKLCIDPSANLGETTMRNLLYLQCFMAGTLFASNSVLAQSDRCRQIIPSGGALRTIDLDVANTLSQTQFNSMVSNKEKAFNLDSAGQASFIADGIPTIAKSALAIGKTRSRALSQTSYSTLDQQQRFELKLSEGDRDIIKAWSDCISASDSIGGLWVKAEKLEDDISFVTRIKYVKPRKGKSSVILRNIYLKNGKIDQARSTCFYKTIFNNRRPIKNLSEDECILYFSRASALDEPVLTIDIDGDNDVSISQPPLYHYRWREKTYEVEVPVNEFASNDRQKPDVRGFNHTVSLGDDYSAYYSFPSAESILITSDTAGGRGCEILSKNLINPRTLSFTGKMWSDKSYSRTCTITVLASVIGWERVAGSEPKKTTP